MSEITKGRIGRLPDGRWVQRYSIGIDFGEIDGLNWKDASAFFDALFNMVPPEGREWGMFSAEQAEGDYDGDFTRATLEFLWDLPETDEEFAARTKNEELAAKLAAEAQRKVQEQRERTLLANLKAKYEP